MNHGATFPVPAFFRPIIKWICPGFLLTIFAMWLLKEIFGFDLATGKAGAISGYVTDLVGSKSSIAAQLSIVLVAGIFVFFGLMTARSKAYKRAEQGLPKTEN
jgi:uncharacterized BrkB/YihY/UPF0761 family membrane protein